MTHSLKRSGKHRWRKKFELALRLSPRLDNARANLRVPRERLNAEQAER